MLQVGSLIKVIVEQEKDVKPKCHTFRMNLASKYLFCTVTILAANGRTTEAAFEDVRPEIAEDLFAMAVQESIHILEK